MSGRELIIRISTIIIVIIWVSRGLRRQDDDNILDDDDDDDDSWAILTTPDFVPLFLFLQRYSSSSSPSISFRFEPTVLLLTFGLESLVVNRNFSSSCIKMNQLILNAEASMHIYMCIYIYIDLIVILNYINRPCEGEFCCSKSIYFERYIGALRSKLGRIIWSRNN